MRDFTFLSVDNIAGIKKFKILENYGVKAQTTDYAILLGADVDGNRNGKWWTSTEYGGNVKIIDENGFEDFTSAANKKIGSRPAILYSSIFLDTKSDVDGKDFVTRHIAEVEFGEFPQTAVSTELNNILEEEYKNSKLEYAYKTYTSSYSKDRTTSEIVKEKNQEYKYKGKRYVRVIASKESNGKKMSNGVAVKAGDPYWIQIEPITWIADRNENIAISKNILVSGMEFNLSKIYRGDFEETSINEYFDKDFAIEILNSKVRENVEYDIKIQMVVDKIWNKIKQVPFKGDYLLYLNAFVEEYKENIKVGDINKKESSLAATKSKLLNLENRIDNVIKTKKDLFEIVPFIEKSIDSINNLDEKRDELQDVFYNVKKISNKYLYDDEYIELIITSLKKELIKIYENIYSNEKIEYNNLDEFIIYARTKLQDILLSFHNDVTNKTYNADIKKAFSKIKNGEYEKKEKDLFETYINGINDIYKNIQDELPNIQNAEEKEIYVDRLNEILDLTKEEKRNLDKLDIISMKFSDIYRLYLDIRYYLEYNITDKAVIK